MENPSAFPVPDYPASRGMTLRDWFAGQALNGLISNHDTFKVYVSVSGKGTVQSIAAGDAYLFADAMLKAREAQ